MDKIDNTCINTIRILSAEEVQKANSGHPGAPMGMAPMAYTLWTKYLKHNPKNPLWIDRDRFVLSAGHASALLYSLLHLTGYDLSLDDLKNFRQWGSKTPGHPEFKHTKGVETTTGPLGQGIANSVGMALAETIISSKFNTEKIKLIDHYTYCIVGDGCLMEGISHEAASFAGHYKLGKLIVLYDSNDITIDGSTNLSVSDDAKKRFESYGWQVLEVPDGDKDIGSIGSAIEKAKNEKEKPSLIIIKTHIAYGSPNKSGTSGAHGSPLGEDEIKLVKEKLGWSHKESFFVPEEAKAKFSKVSENGTESEKEWNAKFEEYKKENPVLAKEFDELMSGKLPKGWEKSLPEFEFGEKFATREASGKVLNSISTVLKNLVGGSADLTPSNNTFLKEGGSYSSSNRLGRNFHFGIREHAMGAIQNGMVLHGGLIPYCGTFLVFSDYMRPTIRLAALMGIRSIFVFTHDSIGVGEDGPTHQPIEHFAVLRAIPDNYVIRPADANETSAAWKIALERKDGPICIVLSRQSLPVLEGTKNNLSEIEKGAYILEETNPNPDIILLATGSEVSLAVESKKSLEKDGKSVRVVSMPSFEIFEKQSQEYKKKVLSSDVPTLSIEMGISMGWDKYSDSHVSIEKFGASAPGNVVIDKYGFNVENVLKEAKDLLE